MRVVEVAQGQAQLLDAVARSPNRHLAELAGSLLHAQVEVLLAQLQQLVAELLHRLFSEFFHVRTHGLHRRPLDEGGLERKLGSREAAEAYARDQGIEFTVTAPHKRKPVVRARGYGENFATDRRGAWTH